MSWLSLAATALEGGNMNERVVRIGDTVRRATSPWTPTIHRLLAHVRAQGVRWVPRVHGIDDEGRKVLYFIPGEVRHDMPLWQRDESILADIAQGCVGPPVPICTTLTPETRYRLGTLGLFGFGIGSASAVAFTRTRNRSASSTRSPSTAR